MLIASTLAILLTWAVAAMVLVGAGSLVLRRFDSNFSALDAFWLGLAVCVGLLEIWNFLWPINATIAILLCSVGAIGLLDNRALLLAPIRGALRSSRWLALLILAIAFFLALRSSGPCDYYDTGLYGAQAVRWIQSYSVVPGLANLHGRFGFNSSVFLCIAALNQGVWRDLAFHLFTGFLIAAIWFSLLPACSRLILGSSTSPADWFYSILAIPTAFWTTRSKIVGTLTDEPTTIACLVGAGMLLEELHRKNVEANQRPNQVRLLVTAGLFALAVTFKQTALVFAFLAWCLVFREIWANARITARQKRYVFGALSLSALIVLPWLVRGIVLSGYPFFPASTLPFPADWKVPLSMSGWYFEGARSWGRMPDVELADTRGLAWLHSWLDRAIRDRASFQAPLLTSLAGLAVAASSSLRKKTRLRYSWLWLVLPALVGVVFWFASSPALRFGQFAIWTLAGTLGTWAILFVPSNLRSSRLVIAGLSVLLIWCLISFGWKPPYARLLTTRPLAPLPQSPVVARQTLSGLTVYVPAEGNQCWNAPLPCTPYFDETLRLRKPPFLRSGFQSDADEKILPRFQKLGSLDPTRCSALPLYCFHGFH